MSISRRCRTACVRASLCACLALTLGWLNFGCAGRPALTRELYQDRMLWVWLEENPYANKAVSGQSDEPVSLSAGTVAAWMKGFRVLTDRGLYGAAAGKSAMDQAFVEAEMFALGPHLAKGLAMAKPNERVAYCFSVDRDGNERYITTAYLYIQQPYLYYRLEEYRTLIRAKSPMASTSEVCLAKPKPGYATADRYFRLEYEPEEFVAGYGVVERFGSFMAGIVENRRGEVVFKLASIMPAPKAQAVHVVPPPLPDAVRTEPAASSSGVQARAEADAKAATPTDLPAVAPPQAAASPAPISPALPSAAERSEKSAASKSAKSRASAKAKPRADGEADKRH